MKKEFIIATIENLENKKINYYSENELIGVTNEEEMKSYQFKINNIEVNEYSIYGTLTTYNRWCAGEEKFEREIKINFDNEGYFVIEGVYTNFEWYGKVNENGTIEKQ